MNTINNNTRNKISKLFLTLANMKKSTTIDINDLYKTLNYNCDDEFFLDLEILIDTKFEDIEIRENENNIEIYRW